MTGRLQPEERHFLSREEARRDFPAVYHIWDRLAQLETIFEGPVMVEFTGVHGTFTILQANAAEMAGAGMLAAMMDLYRTGRTSAERIRRGRQAVPRPSGRVRRHRPQVAPFPDSLLPGAVHPPPGGGDRTGLFLRRRRQAGARSEVRR